MYYIKNYENEQNIAIRYLIFFLFFVIISTLNPDGFNSFSFFNKDAGIKSYIKEWQGIFYGVGSNLFIYQIFYIIIGLFF